MANPLSIPYQDDWVGSDRRLTRPARDFLTVLSQGVSVAPSRVQSVNLPVSTTTPVNDAIPTTDIPLPTVFAGLYRVTWYARITAAAITSSSLQVTIGWTDGGIPCSVTSAAITGNTTTTTGTASLLLRSDAATPITYATTYASNGANEMTYSLSVVLESIQTSGGVS